MKPYKHLGIPEWTLSYKGTSPGTKGGQNANRNYTAVELRFDTKCLANIEPKTLHRLQQIAKSRINNEGILVIKEKGTRSYEKNLWTAVYRLEGIFEKARKKVTKRKQTKPTAGSKIRRRESKDRHSRKKTERRLNPSDY